jgi:hypothetical protein
VREKMPTHHVTLDQAERKKRQAAAFMERIGASDRAEEFDNMSDANLERHLEPHPYGHARKVLLQSDRK